MSRLRHCLLHGGLSRQCLMCVVFAVLISRALLSGVVMLDPAAPAGSFGLVMCSGHGPLFHDDGPLAVVRAADLMSMSTMSMAMPTSDASMMGTATPHVTDPHEAIQMAGMPMDHTAQDAGDASTLCPFSAVFLAALVTAVFIRYFFGWVITASTWAVTRILAPVRRLFHRHPPSHAPPVFA